MKDFFEDENISKNKLEKELHIGSSDNYFISKEVYDAEVGDGDFTYWEKVIKELDTTTRSKDCYYNQKIISIDKISENSLLLNRDLSFEKFVCGEKFELEIFLREFYKAEKINSKQQERFEMFYIENKTYSEIAKIDGVKRQSITESIEYITIKVKAYFKNIYKNL